ncbi:MAG: hypothetical protein M1815_001022 [Lichina confinis]|nr:MAG: hypothetical protein M1815_001022 [Lichina confinis]
MVSSAGTQHHHRPSTKLTHKSFKSRHASKSAVKALLKGKTEKGSRRTPHQQTMSKLERKNQARQKQQKKQIELARARSIFSGLKGVAKTVVVVPLHDAVDATAAMASLSASLDMGDQMMLEAHQITVNIERFKQQIRFVVSQPGILAALDACRLADFVVLVLSADADLEEDGGHIIKAVEGQVVTATVRGKGLKADRLVQLGEGSLCQVEKIVADLATTGPGKRNGSIDDNETAEEKVLDEPTQDRDELADLLPFEPHMVDATEEADAQTHVSRQGVLLDDHHYFSEEGLPSRQPPKRVPKGTSAYQAAWYLDDDTDSSLGSDVLDEDGDLSMDRVNDGGDSADIAGPSSLPPETEAAPSVVAPSEMFLDPSPEEEMEQVAAFRMRQRDEAQDDFEFPDEIELSPKVVARERLSRYRGLKSLRTSPWQTEEDQGHEPENWHRLLRCSNYRGAGRRAIREARVGGVQAGTKVNVHLRNVPISLAQHDLRQRPLGLFSLLRHEQKRTVVNVSITLDAACSQPIKSKEELIVQLGSRRFVINPIFSQAGETPNNVHKYDRYLHPGRTAVATFIGPVTWGPVPALFFKRRQAQPPTSSFPPFPNPYTICPTAQSQTGPLDLIGKGTNLAGDVDRVTTKRVIMTGHPYKIHRKVVTVRYMFFNADDVHWFKALPLWTKRGRRGFIKESLGTHGYFKATFDGPLNPQDTICLSLYKRVFPREASLWHGDGGWNGDGNGDGNGDVNGGEGDVVMGN